MKRRFMCRFCWSIFQKEEISTPMTNKKGERIGDWVWMRDQCPKCGKGLDDWYVPEREWADLWRDAVRYQRNVKRDARWRPR